VRLRHLTPLDRPAVRRWMRDPEVIRYTVLVPGPEYGPVRPYTPAAADRYLRTLIEDEQRRSFAVLLDGRHVGNVGLKELDLSRREAECFIEIGELTARRSGVGSEAMAMLLAYAFDELDLARVRLGVFEFNEPALRLYRRLGFGEDGLYGWHYAQGRFWRVRQMSLGDAAWRRLPTRPGAGQGMPWR
jgi:RimJ/RimL family protein N-acetyltransferase